MKTSQRGIDLIKSFEGFSEEAYLCPAGIWTIGYGHTGRVQPGGRVTEAEAEILLRHDLEWHEARVRKLVTKPMRQGQFDAFVSLSFNTRADTFAKSSAVRLFNEGLDYDAGNAFLLICKARVDGELITLNGLVRRRKAERELFRAAD